MFLVLPIKVWEKKNELNDVIFIFLHPEKNGLHNSELPEDDTEGLSNKLTDLWFWY